jgi:hypothetical protein
MFIDGLTISVAYCNMGVNDAIDTVVERFTLDRCLAIGDAVWYDNLVRAPDTGLLWAVTQRQTLAEDPPLSADVGTYPDNGNTSPGYCDPMRRQIFTGIAPESRCGLSWGKIRKKWASARLFLQNTAKPLARIPVESPVNASRKQR